MSLLCLLQDDALLRIIAPAWYEQTGDVKIQFNRFRCRWFAKSRTETQIIEANRMMYELHMLYTKIDEYGKLWQR